MKQELGGGLGETTLSAWQGQIQATLDPSIEQQCFKREPELLRALPSITSSSKP
jgi:hypothetical protein